MVGLDIAAFWSNPFGQVRETTGIPWVHAEVDAMNAEADLVGAPRIAIKAGK